MAEQNLPVPGSKSFEELKQVNQHGAEYWTARDLQPLLGYRQWRSFDKAVSKAITSCDQSGNDPTYHFARARKPIDLGKGGVQDVDDYLLSRFACYLIAQNGDPRISEIAESQKYFAIQTRRQELSDALAADLERLETRKQTSEEFKALSGASRNAGVQDRMFGVFHDAGSKGLYGGLGNDQTEAKKGTRGVHVFICHASEDKGAARELASAMRQFGADVWFDEWEIRVGDSIIQRIDHALGAVSHLIVLLSQVSVNKPWVRKELSSALIRQLSEKSITVIPLRLDECVIPSILADIRYADARAGMEHAIIEIKRALLSGLKARDSES